METDYYPWMISLNKFNGDCNGVDSLSTETCVPCETKDLNLNAFNIITRINEVKTLAKHISCVCQCKFDSTTCGSDQKWKNDKCQCECKKYPICKKDFS